MSVQASSRYGEHTKNAMSVDQDHRLLVLLEQVCHMAQETRERELTRFGITGEQAAVLFAVKAIGDKATPAEISRWTLRESQSTSAILDRMEKAGLIVRVKGIWNERICRILISPFPV